MASVQELIDAANSQKSPGISAMEGLARGYLSGQQQALDRAKTLIMLEQNRREQEMRMREQEMMMKNQERLSAQMAAQVDAARKQELKGASSGPEPVTQQMKTKDVWERNEKGQLSLRTEFSSPESPKPSDNEVQYTLDQNGNAFDVFTRKPITERVQGVTYKNVALPTTARSDANEFKQQKRIDDNTLKLSRALDSVGGIEAITQFKTISEIIPKSGDIPGYGAAESLVPNALAGKEARSLRMAVQGLQNVKIKDRSGAAVTPPEFVRLAQELGTGKFKTDDELRQGLNQALSSYRERVRNVMAGFDDETKNAYLSREGVENPLDVLSGFDFGGSYGKAKPMNGNGATTQASSQSNSEIALNGSAAQRLAELRAKKASGTLR